MLFFIRYKTVFEPIEENILSRYSHIYSGDTAKYVHSITNKIRKKYKKQHVPQRGRLKKGRIEVEEGENGKKGVPVCLQNLHATIFM